MTKPGKGLMKSSSHLTQHNAKEAEMKEKAAKLRDDLKTTNLAKIKSLQKQQTETVEK